MPHSRFACSGDLKRRHLPWDIQNRSTQGFWGTFGFVSDVYYMLIICIKSRCQYNLLGYMLSTPPSFRLILSTSTEHKTSLSTPKTIDLTT